MSEANADTLAAIDPSSDGSSETWMSLPPRSEGSVGAGDVMPEWYREFQNRAWRDFLSLDDPTRKDQAWRFANLKRSKFENLVGGPQLAVADSAMEAELVNRSVEVPHPSARFVFHNNRLIADERRDLPEGVIALPMADALARHGDLLRDHFMRDEPRLGGEKFAALHGAADLSGIFLYVPDGVEVDEPVEVFHWASGDSATVFPHTLIVTGKQASVSLVDYFESAENESETMAIAVSDLVVGDASKIQYTAVQEWNSRSRHFQLNSTRVGRDANASRCVVHLGASWARDESTSHLLEPGGNSDMLAVNLATGDEEYDLRTLQLHEAEHTTSDLLYKNALYDHARTIFSGLIMVGEKAHYTDAFQTCRNLLGSDDAEANAMPGLEINADQVKCSHGSTSGQISDEEVFYLKARGIDSEKARRMITFGFLNEVVSKISCPDLGERLTEKLRKKFDSLA